ncbi:MAG TPA: glutaminase A [Ilumatobacter sp.]|nr:glutaminase A [Ilumatobacter sp.]
MDPHDATVPRGFVSTGELPPGDRVSDLLHRAHTRFRAVDDGTCSDVYPALARVDPALFAIAVTGVSGTRTSVGDIDRRFTLMSLSKPFVLALVCESIGPETVRERIGVDATGRPFNSIEAVERSPHGRTNPMVNSGAIATTALIPSSDLDHRWDFVVDGLSRFAGRPLDLDREVLGSALRTNDRNRAIARLLHSLGAITVDPDDTVELYTRQCSLAVDVDDLAAMGATLANGGTNPITGEVVVSPVVCHDVMAVMATAGMYDTSGTWLWRVGLPGKSGISGGIVTVSPGKGGLGTFSPPLDHAGNSVRGQLASEFLAAELGLDVFATRPVDRPAITR